MSNVLKVGTTIPGYENNIKNNPYTTVETTIPSPVDPSKVARPDGRGDAGQQQDAKLGFGAESNFGTFIQMVKEAPQLSQIFTELIFSGMSNLIEAGIGEDFAKDIAGFFAKMQMSEQELMTFIKGQSNGAVRFKGAFFNLLRQVLNDTNSVELKAGILDFVKKYNDMSSAKHLMENITGNLKDIESLMYRSDRQALDQLIQKLILPGRQGGTNANPMPAETEAAEAELNRTGQNPQQMEEGTTVGRGSEFLHAEQNVQVLKGEIIPLLSQYIGKTHDLGTIRDIINLLTFNTARYENGNLDGLLQSFKRLMNYQQFAKRFQGVNEENLMEVLSNTDFDKAAGKTEWTDTFLSILSKGLKGEAGLENKQVFENVMHAVLLNESVYMPVLHLMIPVELQGNLMFSEMWVDPDAEGEGSESLGGRKVKLLVKFDIKDVGFFDMVMLYGNERMEMQLYYPERLQLFEKEIQTGLSAIMAKNNIAFESLNLAVNKGSKTITEVFPKIYERRNTINVKI